MYEVMLRVHLPNRNNEKVDEHLPDNVDAIHGFTIRKYKTQKKKRI